MVKKLRSIVSVLVAVPLTIPVPWIVRRCISRQCNYNYQLFKFNMFQNETGVRFSMKHWAGPTSSTRRTRGRRQSPVGIPNGRLPRHCPHSCPLNASQWREKGISGRFLKKVFQNETQTCFDYLPLLPSIQISSLCHRTGVYWLLTTTRESFIRPGWSWRVSLRRWKRKITRLQPSNGWKRIITTSLSLIWISATAPLQAMKAWLCWKKSMKPAPIPILSWIQPMAI